MKFLRSRYFIICLLVAIILALVPAILAAVGQTDILRSAVKTVAKPFEAIGSYVADAADGVIGVFTDYDRLKEENEELRREVESLKADKYDLEVIKDENEWLRSFLAIHNDSPEYLLKDARIVSYEAGNYATVITLNKGKAHGVLRNMPVITPDGVLGYVSEVGLDWCKVSSIVESANAVGGYVERSGALGVVEGTPELRTEGCCRMLYDADSDIKIGDRVFTSGTGSIYPSGLLVGEVVSIDADPVTRKLVAKIEPSVDYFSISSLGRVMLIAGYEG